MRRNSKVFVAFTVIAFAAFATITKSSTVQACWWGCGDGKCFSYFGRDLTTQGNWIDSTYGGCGYALPYTEVEWTEMGIGKGPCEDKDCWDWWDGCGDGNHWDGDCGDDDHGDGDCGCGECDCCEIVWFEPWSMQGEKYYPYEDYLGGKNILEYEVSGPTGPPRELVDANSIYYRPSWYCHNSSITVTLSVTAGCYNVSVYLVDWDAPVGGLQKHLNVTVTSGGESDNVILGTTFLENFAAGVYAIFEVNSPDGIIEIEVVNLDYPSPPEHGKYATISGIFLDRFPCTVTGVNFVGLDRETMGNWRPHYLDNYYLLPAFNVPVSNVSYIPINKAYDEVSPGLNYQVSEGVCQFAADDARTCGEYPYIGQYAAYVWIENSTQTASDPRVLIYPEDKIFYGYPPTPLNGRMFGAWDSGEMGWPLNYFTMEVTIPTGMYIFSIYALDFEQIGRSETIEIWDECMTTLLDSQYITGCEINNGIYLQWLVCGPRTITVKVIADKGNLNSLISGIFLNCLNVQADPCNVFCVESNSTVTSLAFNSTSQELSFTVTGLPGTTGYTKVYIIKSLINNIAEVKVYLDGAEISYTVASLDDSWLIHFTYKHSTHEITVKLSETSTTSATTPPEKETIHEIPIVAIIAIVALVIVYHKRH